MEDTDAQVQSKVKELLGELLVACRTLFLHPVSEMAEHAEDVYRIFSRLSTFIKEDLSSRYQNR